METVLHESDVRKAVRADGKGSFFGKTSAKDMTVQKISMSERHFYQFKAVVEYRKMIWDVVPYEEGMVIDTPSNGPLCGVSMWSIPVTPPTGFNFKSKIDKKNYEIPHTSLVCVCEECSKLGIVKCSRCNAIGIHACSKCKGSGSITKHEDSKKCGSCHGQGRIPCLKCNGIGRLKCPACAGLGDVKKFQAISVNWKVISEKRVDLEKGLGCLIPESKLKTVNGKNVEYFSPGCDVNNNPLSEHHEDRVVEISKTMFEKYELECVASSDYGHGKRIINCQQIVETIPIAEVAVTSGCRGDQETFFVFGTERKVFYPNGQGYCCSVV